MSYEHDICQRRVLMRVFDGFWYTENNTYLIIHANTVRSCQSVEIHQASSRKFPYTYVASGGGTGGGGRGGEAPKRGHKGLVGYRHPSHWYACFPGTFDALPRPRRGYDSMYIRYSTPKPRGIVYLQAGLTLLIIHFMNDLESWRFLSAYTPILFELK